MIKFAAITPHPPIIIPGIGKPNDLKYVQSTIGAMKQLTDKVSRENIDILIMISPHGTIYPDRMNIAYGGEFQGSFLQFGKDDIRFDYMSDDKFAENLIYECEEEGIGINRYTENDNLDHGIMVPLYYLRDGLRDDVRIVPINYSMLSAATHFSFGEIISQVASNKEFKDKNIGVIASGDMSHRLFQDSSQDISDAGKEFDKKIQEDIKNNHVLDILEYDPDWLEAAGECGYKSIVILLGALSKVKYSPDILSYEGPFGVGYMVVNFKIDK